MSISCDHSLQPISNSTKLSRSLTVPPFVVIRNIYLICVILCDLLLRNINENCLLLLKFKLPFHQKYLFQSCHLIATFFPRIYQLLMSSTETAFSSNNLYQFYLFCDLHFHLKHLTWLIHFIPTIFSEYLSCQELLQYLHLLQIIFHLLLQYCYENLK